MYILKLTKKEKGKTEVVKSNKGTYEQISTLLENVVNNTKNFTNIEFLGMGKVKITKFNRVDVLEIIEE